MKTRNFDKFIEERAKVSPTFTIFGKEYKLPPSLPYDVVLYFKAAQLRDENEKVDEGDVLNIFEKMIGKDTLNEIKSNPQFDFDLAMQLMAWLFEIYGLSNENTTEKKGRRATTR